MAHHRLGTALQRSTFTGRQDPKSSKPEDPRMYPDLTSTHHDIWKTPSFPGSQSPPSINGKKRLCAKEHRDKWKIRMGSAKGEAGKVKGEAIGCWAGAEKRPQLGREGREA